MKKYFYFTLLVPVAAVCGVSQLSAKHLPATSRLPHLFAEESDEHEEGPSEVVIRKLAAMMPDQTFKRDGTKESDGKIAPKDATLYIVDINDKDGKLLFKTFFFKGENGKWSLFDEAGNVMHET